MATNKTVTNSIYKAGSAKEVVVPAAKVVVTAPAVVPAKITVSAPGADTSQPAQVAVNTNKGTIYKMGVPPVAGIAKH